MVISNYKACLLLMISPALSMEAASPTTLNQDSASIHQQDKKISESSDWKWSFPRKYNHLPPQEQLKEYRRIYDKAAANPGVTFHDTHIEGLFEKLLNGFALVAQFIEEASFVDDWVEPETHVVDGQPIKIAKYKLREDQFELLEKLYLVAFTLENQQKMTQNNFLILNQLLAIIADEYKGVELTSNREMEGISIEDIDDKESITNEEEPSVDEEEMWDEIEKTLPLRLLTSSTVLNHLRVHEKGFYKTVEEIEKLFGLDAVLYRPWAMVMSENGDEIIAQSYRPPAVIYTNLKKTGIAPRSFVDQTLNYDYPMGIMLFKVEAFPIKRPLRESEAKAYNKIRPAHYGIFSGTFNLLGHDIQHGIEQYQLENQILVKFNVDWEENLRRINHIRLSYQNHENYMQDPKFQILTNGLFLLSHELLNISRGNLFDKANGLVDNPENVTFISILKTIEEMMGRIFSRYLHYDEESGDYYYYKINRDSLYYRQEFKDHEFILHNKKDINNKPFLTQSYEPIIYNQANYSEKIVNNDGDDSYANYKSSVKKKLKLEKSDIMQGYRRFWKDFIFLSQSTLR